MSDSNTTATTTVSLNLDDMSLDQLVQLQQGLGRQIDKLRDQRAYLNVKIAQRLAAGERNGQPAQAEEPAESRVDGVAQGVVIEADARA
jgi:hypothetical protein